MALDLDDKTSNGNDLTNNGADDETSELPAGLSGTTNAAKFVAGNSDYMTRANASLSGFDDITTNGTFTAEFWIYPTTVNTNMTIMSMWDATAGGDDDRSWLVHFNAAAGDIRVQAMDSSANQDAYDANDQLSVTTWAHWAITCDVSEASASTFEFYKNGSSIGNGDSVVANNISAIRAGVAADFYIATFTGGAGTRVNFLNGILDDVRLWSDVRTSTEISNNYESRLNGNEAGLVGYWPWEALGGAAATQATGIMSPVSKFWGS